MIALFAACSNEITDLDNPKSSDAQHNRADYHPTYKYAFAYKVPKEGYTKAFMLKTGKWDNGDTIKIKMLNGTPAMQEKVKEISKEWQKYINLTFQYVPSTTANKKCDVRISFYEPGSAKYGTDKMSWSEIGTLCTKLSRGATANIYMVNYNDATELNSIDFRAQVLRIFGHILGLPNEHQAEQAKVELDEDEAINYYKGFGWDEDLIFEHIITQYTERAIKQGVFDQNSIMLMYIPNYLFTYTGSDKVPDFEVINTKLSENDITFIKAMYPKTLAGPWVKGKSGSVWTYMNTGAGYGQYSIADYNWDTHTYTNNSYMCGTYKTIGVGEYTWTTQNLKLMYRALWGKEMLSKFNIDESFMKGLFSREYIPFPGCTLNDFLDVFGTYITEDSELGGAYRHPDKYLFFDKENGTRIKGWELPDYYDILQLLGQMPVKYAKVADNARDFFYANAEIDSIPNFNLPMLCTYSSTSGLRIVPMGFEKNNYWEARQPYYFGKAFGLKIKSAPDFQYGKNMFVFKENDLIVGTPGDYNNGFFHFCSARYCKKMSDEELGYKMYASDLTDQVIFLPLNETPKTAEQYKELPKGLERGIALRYATADRKKCTESWSTIKAEAAKMMKEIVLDIWYH